MSYIAEIPYGAYWCTPFSKWQGSLSNLNSLEFAAWVAKSELARRDLSADIFDYTVLGITIPQQHSFYGAPWVAALLGADRTTGPTIHQACATGTRSLLAAAQEVNAGLSQCALMITADRCSNAPHVFYPNPAAPGGTGSHENWLMDNINCDPMGRHPMLVTAENVAKKHGITTEEQHEVVLLRQEQYQMALADGQAFQKRYMTLPFDVPSPNYKKVVRSLDGDEGIKPSTAEGLAGLRPVMKEGTVTFGGQTHPADGNAGMILTTPERARELSTDSSIRVRLLGFGSGRVELAYMPEATICAAQQALQQSGHAIGDMHVVKSHNPFAVNDIVFSRETGVALKDMNNYGCSLIWGHPQGPTATRAIIEMIEELVIRGGGLGLFEGCAAGDTAMSVVISVET